VADKSDIKVTPYTHRDLEPMYDPTNGVTSKGDLFARLPKKP